MSISQSIVTKFHRFGLASLVLATLFGTGCSVGQKRFSSPEDAVNALVIAAKAGQSEEVNRILGRGAEEITSSGDEVADRLARDRFLQAYDAKHTLVGEPDGSVTLQVGLEDWPMPIPLVERGGSWRFDTQRGKEEVLNRRIGRNELDVQEVGRALVDAQREYKSVDHDGDGVLEYAQKLISDQGQRNGLYWETAPGEPASPIGPLVAEAVAEGYGPAQGARGQRRPYHGYYFKLLRSQGTHAPGGAREYMVNGNLTEGFAVLAWPAEYGNSGIMTFLVNHHGVIYERDLGRRTESIADEITVFDPDSQWSIQ